MFNVLYLLNSFHSQKVTHLPHHFFARQFFNDFRFIHDISPPAGMLFFAIKDNFSVLHGEPEKLFLFLFFTGDEAGADGHKQWRMKK